MRISATPSSRPSCARTAASWTWRGRPAAVARRARRPEGGPPLAHDLVVGRQVDHGGDGARSRRARVRVPRDHRSLALPAGGPARATGGRARGAQRAARPFRLLHGIEVNIRADASLDVDDHVLAGLDWVIASCTTRSSGIRRAHWPRWRTRTSAPSAISPGDGSVVGPVRTWISSRSSSARSRPARCSRSTRSRTGSTCATATPPGRRGRRADRRLDRCAFGEGARLRGLGIGQARRAWLTRAILNTRPWPEIAKLAR